MGETFDRELRLLLAQAGCKYVRSGKGSHELWWSPITNRHFAVPHNVVIRHTANGVLKQAGLPKKF